MIRVVVADGQTLVLRALSLLLSIELDIEVVAQARDGFAALDAVREHAPDVLVSEIAIAGMSGLDLAERLVAEQSSTRVVILTAAGRGGHLRRAMAAGVRGYLFKDAPPDEFVSTIRRVAAGRYAVRPELVEAAREVPDNPLTERQRAVLWLASEGRSNKDIANILGLSPGTVRNYLSEAAARLGASSRVEAGRIAQDLGWL